MDCGVLRVCTSGMLLLSMLLVLLFLFVDRGECERFVVWRRRRRRRVGAQTKEKSRGHKRNTTTRTCAAPASSDGLSEAAGALSVARLGAAPK